MSLSGHQRPHRGASDEWLTPPEILAEIGPFDLDPCASVERPWPTAKKHYTVIDNGLNRQWRGFVWCNPPFGPEAASWLMKLASHGNGIALCPARTETRWFVDAIWHRADAILFLHGRPYFHRVTGERGPTNSGAPICLVAYGPTGTERLNRANLKGSLVRYWQEKLT